MDRESTRLGSYPAMTAQHRDPTDPAILAASVRDLALEARRIINDTARNPFEVGALSRRIDDLQRLVPGQTTSELSRWLNNLSREVHAVPRLERKVRV